MADAIQDVLAHIGELEAENARLALRIVRMEHEQQERALQRVLYAVEDQNKVEANLAAVHAYLSMASHTVCGGEDALRRLGEINSYIYRGG